MSEDSPIYGQGPAHLAIYKRYGEGYVRPTPEEVNAELGRTGLKGAQVASLLGFKYSREVRKLTSGEKFVIYCVWRRLCGYTGSVQPDTRAKNYMPEASEASQQRQPREADSKDPPRTVIHYHTLPHG